MKRRWVINGRFLAQPLTGVQRYARELLQALDDLLHEQARSSDDLELRLLVPASVTALPSLRHIEVEVVGGRLSGHAWEQLALPLFARGGILSFCNTGPLLPMKQIVCIHDLNTRIVPESYSPAFRSLYRALIPALARMASRVTTVSEYSANQLVEHGICRREKLLVIPNGHEHVHRWRPAPHALSDATPNRIAVIGSTAKHKNIGMLLKLAPQLHEHGLSIAIVGRLDRSVFGVQEHAQGHPNVEWLGGLPDAELADLLGSSLCLAFPSFTEGFGLPPLEAMALGCPVVVSNTASLPEVCGDAALYAPPNDPAAWCEAFLALKREPELRVDMIERGLKQSRRFSWPRSAALYLRAMAQLDGVADTQDQATAQSGLPTMPPNPLTRSLDHRGPAL